MILINSNWEFIRNIQDVSKIIREHYHNYELASILDELIPEHDDDDYYTLECYAEDLQDEVYALEDVLDCKDSEIEDLNEKIKELEQTISELENRISDFELDF